MHSNGVGVSGVGVSNSDIFSELGNSKSQRVGLSKSNIEFAQAKKEYRIALYKYRLAYDKILHNSNQSTISLNKENNRTVIEEAFQFWEGKRIANHAWCIMSNHFHWILTVFEKEFGVAHESENPLSDNHFDLGKSKSQGVGLSKSDASDLQSGKSDTSTLESQSPLDKPVYLQDILHSVKLFTARKINENEGRTGQLWEHESFDTTIRNEMHFSNVFNYVINNPVSAGLVSDWRDWPGTRTFHSP